ncbi:hypothetical protein C1H46_001030 [Malus baccata]|uniref:H15 domain-containing protein n=1 Tax=Malus baccata TaxID=106549 RepID=A0A540NS61_MALBA|nr:hypothetical protein C1H46_001030 [Malus baccata]
MATKEASVVVATKMVENPPPEPVTTDTADDKPTTKASKAKKPKAKKAPASRKPRSALIHPPYEEMVKEAIVMLKEMTGSSQYTITKYHLFPRQIFTDQSRTNIGITMHETQEQ